MYDNERRLLANRKIFTFIGLKDVRANCFCASLLRTQIHTPRHKWERALSNKMNNDRAGGHCYSFAWIYDLGRSVTPTFLSRNRFNLQLSQHCPNMNKTVGS